MALGGGFFTTTNKVLNGAYINFVSAARTTVNVSDRGVVALPISLDWGVDGEVFEVSQTDFQKDSLSIFGYAYTDDALKPLREVFANAVKVYFYKLNSDGAKATGGIATAKYAGLKGNELKYVVSANIDDETKFDVKVYVGTTLVNEQTNLSTAAELKDNEFVVWNKEGELAVSTQVLSGGTNGSELTGASYQTALDKLEPYNFNILVCNSLEETVKSLFTAFTKRLRDQQGVKFQTVIHKYEKADYEGVVSVENETLDGANKNELVYWVAGALAGCAVNKSCTNKIYNGEYLVNVDYKQSEIENGMLTGKFMFHQVENNIRVVTDIDSFITFTEEKNKDFSKNQIVRVLDQIGNDIARLFNTKYLGQIPNDKDGRISFWNDVVAFIRTLESIRAIQDFNSEDVIVEAVDGNKDAVAVSLAVTPTVAMEKLYMTVIVQ